MIDLRNESHSGRDLSNSRCVSLRRMGRGGGSPGVVVMGQTHLWGGPTGREAGRQRDCDGVPSTWGRGT